MSTPERRGAGIITDGMSETERLFHYSCATGSDEPHFLAFRGLQRFNIVRLQNELAKKKGNMWTNMTAEDARDLSLVLHQYGKLSVQHVQCPR